MPYIIDGHNLIGKLPEISLRDMDDEVYLIHRLENYFRTIRKKAVVFFDNAAIGSTEFTPKTAFLKVFFIRKPQTADQAIINTLKSLKGNARNYTVISSDHWIVDHARKAGANVLRSEDFKKILQDQGSRSDNKSENSEKDINYWLKIFNSDS